MTSFADHLAADRRLALLRTLRDLDGHANESVLLDGLHLLGHIRTTGDDVRADLDLLKAAGAITDSYFAGKVRVAHLTERGIDIAAGRIVIDGVKRPKVIG